MDNEPLILDDVHTSDITCACPKRAELRLRGHVFAETQTATATGQVFHALASAWWTGVELTASDAFYKCAAEAKGEGQPFSTAVVNNAAEVIAKVSAWMDLYAARFEDTKAASEVIGVELPIRYSLDVDGEPQNFASHIDLLRRQSGRLKLRDWKSGEDAPHFAYLRRNLQLGLYWLAIAEGEVCIDADLDHWVNFGEWVDVEWLHVRNLEPYKKACPGINDAGEPVNWKKGDLRPMRQVVRKIDYIPAQAEALKEELRTRVRMFRAGHWPMNPDPVGCGLCQSKMYCPAWGVKGDENDGD